MFKLTKITFSTENLFNFVCPVTNTENIISKEIYCAVCCENQITDALEVRNIFQQVLHRPLQILIIKMLIYNDK